MIDDLELLTAAKLYYGAIVRDTRWSKTTRNQAATLRSRVEEKIDTLKRQREVTGWGPAPLVGRCG